MARRKNSGKVLVVIPYLAKEAQGKELYYAVAGWRKHFKEDYLIVVVGDRHPVVDTGKDIEFLDCPRVSAVTGEYRAHLDHVNKFRKVLEAYPEYDGFIYTCDDMYAVNDFTLDDVKVPKIQEEEISSKPGEMNAWRRNNAKTKKLLKREGLPVRNYVCHLPVYYEKDKLLAIYDKYDCDHHSYVVEQLYFNTYNDKEPVLVTDEECMYKHRINRAHHPVASITDAFHTTVWLNNSVQGWIKELDRLLGIYYGV